MHGAYNVRFLKNITIGRRG
jgi:hypothetical protein